MKKHLLLFFLMLIPMLVCAYDVEINGFCYNLIPKAKQAEVTYPDREYSGYSGNVVIPESVVHEGVTYSVTSIGESAFRDCGLTSVVIPNTVTSIGEEAFRNCLLLSSVTIPGSVKSIGRSAFYPCRSLKKVIIPDIGAWFGITFGDTTSSTAYLSNPLWNGGHVYSDENTEVTELVIPNSVTEINSNAFYGCSNLTSVVIPNSVTSIGNDAFAFCSNLTSVVIPNSVTSIGESAFRDCGLTSVVIPNSVTSLGEETFEGCSNLTSVDISNSVTNLKKRIFYGCSSLTSVTIPNSVKLIENEAFSGCNALETIIIGSGLKRIYSLVFANSKNLTEVTCLAQNVPTTSVDAFENSMIEYATLNVLRSANDYRNTKPWSDFGNIVSFTPVYKLTYMLDGEEYKTYEYEEGESITPEPDPTKEGYFFSGWSEIPETMPANEVIVTGSFLLKPVCATPTITLLPNGKVKVESATEGATCVTNITATNAEPITDGEISLSKPLVVYTITSYATKEGYDDSEVATSTFRYEKKEGDINDDGNLNISDVVQLVNMILGN